MNNFHQNLGVNLTDFERSLVLNLFPVGAFIVFSEYFDNYNLPCPKRVGVKTVDGQTEIVVLRTARHGSVESEAQLLKELLRLGLPVPSVLAEPIEDSDGKSICVLSLLPGGNLQKFSMESVESCRVGKRLLMEGVTSLSEMTGRLAQGTACQVIPRRTLSDQLQSVADMPTRSMELSVFPSALEVLRPVLAAIDTPLVFTNGDYQPGNFLTDGVTITGFVDFETACFQDPLIGFAKYPIYDLHPLNEAGIVPYLLKYSGFSERDFAARLALGCILTLQEEVLAHGEDFLKDWYGQHISLLLDQSIDLLVH